MKKVIITGSNGFVGDYAVREFLNEGYYVIGADIAEESRCENKSDMFKYISCDVFSKEELLARLPHDDYEALIHFAWIGSAGEGRTDYQLQMKNALGTVECMKAAKDTGCRRFVGIGSIMEYEAEAAVHAQGSHPGLGYIYGIGKHAAHCLCKSVSTDIGIDFLWPMITNAYGAGELSPRFINTTLRKIIHNEPLQFTAATQNYDFIYVTDVAAAIRLISEKGNAFYEYMIGSGNARPLREFIIEMQQALAPDAKPLFGDVPFTGVNMPLSIFDIEAVKRDTGFSPQIGFAEGTKRTMEWLKELEK